MGTTCLDIFKGTEQVPWAPLRWDEVQRIRAAIHLAAGNKKMAAANGYSGDFTGVYAAEHSGASAFEVLTAAMPAATDSQTGHKQAAASCEHHNHSA